MVFENPLINLLVKFGIIAVIAFTISDFFSSSMNYPKATFLALIFFPLFVILLRFFFSFFYKFGNNFLEKYIPYLIGASFCSILLYYCSLDHIPEIAFNKALSNYKTLKAQLKPHNSYSTKSGAFDQVKKYSKSLTNVTNHEAITEEQKEKALDLKEKYNELLIDAALKNHWPIEKGKKNDDVFIVTLPPQKECPQIKTFSKQELENPETFLQFANQEKSFLKYNMQPSSHKAAKVAALNKACEICENLYKIGTKKIEKGVHEKASNLFYYYQDFIQKTMKENGWTKSNTEKVV